MDPPHQCGGSGSVESISFPWIRIRIKKLGSGIRIQNPDPNLFQIIWIRIQLKPLKKQNNFNFFTLIQMIIFIWIQVRIQGNYTDSTDPYFFAGAGSKLFSSDPGSGSERGPVQNQIKSRILYPYPNLKVSNPPDGKKTQLFYLRLRSENLLLITKLLLYSLAPMPLPPPHFLEQLFFISTYTGTLFKFSDFNLR